MNVDALETFNIPSDIEMNSTTKSIRRTWHSVAAVILFAILISLLVFDIALSQSRVAIPVARNWHVEKVREGFRFVEGPVWKEGFGLLFSDIPADRIYRWTDNDGLTEFLSPSDSSNGLTYDPSGRLVFTQMKKRRIARMEEDGSVTTLVSTYLGKRFHCPNDLVYSPGGSLFFTDPDFNIPKGEKAEMSFRGIFRLSPTGTLHLIDSTFDKPNGICFSPDGSKLYVNDSRARVIYAWDHINDSTIVNKSVLFSIPAVGYADGMKTDGEGNIYCTGPGGVWIISPSGTLKGRIPLPESPTNCAWGNAEKTTLFITATTGLYRARLADSR